MPSPVVMAAALSRRTKNAKIAILGNAFCLREHPLTLAEEHAMIDCITGGRLITGMVRGIGAEYYSMGVNPAFSHARFQEAHDLVVQAWTKPGPFAFEGKLYHFEYVNVWPRPYQQPHPPIWVAVDRLDRDDRMGGASVAQIRLSAGLQPDRSRWRAISTTIANARSACTATRQAPTRSAGRRRSTSPTPTQKARDEAKPHIEALFNRLLRLPFEMLFPPGYLIDQVAEEHAQPQALGQRPGAHRR